MPQKYCQKCKKLIEEGKEIKTHKTTNYYSSHPRNYYSYYLCPECYEKQQEEDRVKADKVWKQVGWTLSIIMLILMVAVVIFFLYQYQRDKKLDKITKKSQKK